MTQQTLDIGLFAGLSPALKWSFLTLGLILQHIDGVGRSGLKGSTDPYNFCTAFFTPRILRRTLVQNCTRCNTLCERTVRV